MNTNEKIGALAVMDNYAEIHAGEFGGNASDLRKARAAVAELIEAANRAAVAAVRGDDNRPGTIRNQDLDALRAALARVRGVQP